MSGFAGFVTCEEEIDANGPDGRLLQRFAVHLASRGPHGSHIAVQGGAAFCFTFLRTGPARQSASQPCSIDGKVWLLGDVRLDGRDELKEQLEQQNGSIGKEITDEELILHVWQARGEAGLATLPGDFALALWDSQARRLVCARDLMGVRPFFYAQVGERLYFSNTLGALGLVPEMSAELDRHFIGDFLLEGWCSDPERTVFRGIRRLAPGHLLEFSRAGLQLRRFAELPVEEPLRFAREHQYVEEFGALLGKAVRDRLPSGPCAIFMSGGLDSTSIAAQAARIAPEGQGLRAYTMDCSSLFEDQETFFASRAAAYIKIPITMDSELCGAPYASWSDMLVRLPEPCAEPFLADHIRLYRLIAADSAVALSGDGGDDVLGGHAWPHLLYLLRQRQLGAAARVFGGYLLANRRIPPLGAGIRTRWRQWRAPREIFADYPQWLNPDFERTLHLRERWQELQALAESPQAHPLHPHAYASLSKPYWAAIYETEDAAWIGAAVERRAPFLDLRIIRFLLRLPPVPWCMEKELLRRAMRGLLPDEVRTRRKTPLSADPFIAYVKKNAWRPQLPADSPSGIREYIDWGRFTSILCGASASELQSAMRPLCLLHWLNALGKI